MKVRETFEVGISEKVINKHLLSRSVILVQVTEKILWGRNSGEGFQILSEIVFILRVQNVLYLDASVGSMSFETTV